MGYAPTTTVGRPYTTVLPEVRAALAEQGFEILTEIDLAAAMKDKVGADIAPQAMVAVTSSDTLQPVADDAASRLDAALRRLAGTPVERG